MKTNFFAPELSAEEAASLVEDGEIVATSGFTPVGHPKAVPVALAARARALHAQGRPFSITLYTGASTGDELDGELARARAIRRRLPYQSQRELREQINSGEVEFLDLHLSSVGQALRSGGLARPRTAIVEGYRLTTDGKLYLPLSAGNSAVFCSMAERVIVELNGHYGEELDGLHDCYELRAAPEQGPIPICRASDRIGEAFIRIDPKKIVAVVRTAAEGTFPEFRPPDDVSCQIASHVVDFLVSERRRGVLPRGLPLQAGVGNVSNAVLSVLARHPQIEPLCMYTEVVQDSIFELIDAGKLEVASTCAVSLSKAACERFRREISELKERFVIRPVEISNHPEVIRRLGVISINTAVEIDLFGNVNSTHVRGSLLLNGIGGSGDFCRNAFLSIYIAPSMAKGGTISSIVPYVTHVDHNEHSVQVVVTEHGVADLRGLSPGERARLMIDRCAHPSVRGALTEMLHDARRRAPGKHTPLLLDRAFEFALGTPQQV